MHANIIPSTKVKTTYPLLDVSCGYIACVAVASSHEHIYQDKFESRTRLAVLDFMADSISSTSRLFAQKQCTKRPIRTEGMQLQ